MSRRRPRGVDTPAAPRGLSLGGASAVCAARPRYNLRRRVRPRRLGLRLDGRSHGAPVALAESVRRARHRLASPRVPGSRRRAQRTASAATPPRLPRVLPGRGRISRSARTRPTHVRSPSSARARSWRSPRSAGCISLRAPRRRVTVSLDIKRVDTALRVWKCCQLTHDAGHSDRLPLPGALGIPAGRPRTRPLVGWQVVRGRAQRPSQGLARDRLAGELKSN